MVLLNEAHMKERTLLIAKGLLTKYLPEYCVAAGIPAEIKYFRDDVSDVKKVIKPEEFLEE